VATITERQPGVFFARVWLRPTREGETGRQVGRVFRGGKKEVHRQVAAWEAELRGTPPSMVSATVADLLGMWEESKQAEWQPTSARDYGIRCRAITEAIGSVRLVDLDPFRVDAWVAGMRRAGMGEGAIRARVSTLRSAIGWGIGRRMMRANPVTEARPKLGRTRRTPRPDTADVAALVAAAGQEDQRAGLGLRLAAVTGARAGEIVALRFDDRAGDRLHIGRQRHTIDGDVLVRARTKTGRDRVVVLDEATVEAIEAWRRRAEDFVGAATEWMLAEPGAGVPPSPRWLYDVFRRSATRAGVAAGRDKGLVLHDLRHWAARTALRDGHDPVTVAARLGHSPETLMRLYAEDLQGDQTEVAASLAARLDA
jgi:integrase